MGDLKSEQNYDSTWRKQRVATDYQPPCKKTGVVYAFEDGSTPWLIYVAAASEEKNSEFHHEFRRECTRRAKAGKSNAGAVRKRSPGEAVVNEPSQAPATEGAAA